MDDPLRPVLEAALEGDGRATMELVRHTEPAVRRLCTALGSPGEEEDLVQETYLRCFGALAGYRGDAPVQAWVLSIARRVCADGVRRRQRGRRLAERLEATAARPTTAYDDPIDDLVRTLEPDRRAAFVLTQLAGLSYEEAALSLGCPIGTIRSRVARARADLVDLVTRAQAQ